MIKQMLLTALQCPYRWSAPFRRLPDFMLIGAQKSGTTTLFEHLNKHPEVLRNPRNRKEIYFFNQAEEQRLAVYRQYFPFKWQQGLVGEGSTVYLHSPQVPERVASSLPTVKLLVVLREPAARAISHYYHHVKRGRELRSIEEAFSVEALECYLRGDLDDGLSYRYLNNGSYVAHLRRWLEFFDPKQICILKAEDLYENPQFVYDRACSFLEIDTVELKPQTGILNEGLRRDEQPCIRERLQAMYAPQVQALMEMNCINFNWSEYVA